MHGREPDLIDRDPQRDRASRRGERGGGAQGAKAEARQRPQTGEPARRRAAETADRI
jgi:hypothetical protein